MSGHGHSHSCGGGCDHDENFEIATDFLLHTKITPRGFECLGEEDDGSGIKVFKNYENRTDRTDFVISDKSCKNVLAQIRYKILSLQIF